MQREQLLAKEAKYQHGLNKSEDEYGDLLLAIRENNTTSSNNSNNNAHNSNSLPRMHSKSELMILGGSNNPYTISYRPRKIYTRDRISAHGTLASTTHSHVLGIDCMGD
jgi:hypothetical protein